ncbi:MAG: glycerol-3-phosphate 1-O-acyltransferase PlsY [Lachnospiraceae bacterium]|jgi:glycerol-3-phosphate acyltransferase PlsY|nr:glycerol-3-phosphate 1-O-acyltransferase PlsY [Lachnospiraceae bacterium]
MIRIVCLAIGYVFGLFQTSYFLGKAHHMDIREHGSGNAGTTNALRTMGKKAAAITLLCDCLKCVLAVCVIRVLFKESHGGEMSLLVLYGAAGCILGHNFPVTMGFKGGKGIAASVGMILAFDWKLFLIASVVFFTFFFLSHYVSLCSLASYLVVFVGTVIFGRMGYYGLDLNGRLELYALMGALMLLAIWRHRENIRRLLAGTENKITFSKEG